MQNKDTFSSYHPLVNFLYFAIILSFSMFTMHPVCLGISFLSGLVYYFRLKGSKAMGLMIKGVLPLFLLTIIINPAFSHEGETVLMLLPTGNPLTFESIVYGISAGFMMISILIWFAVFNEIITSDKFVYLFGRIVPALSLLLSMTLRFVPRFTDQFHNVKDSMKALGRDTDSGGLIKRIKNAIACFSIVVTWSLEGAIETADSMKSRGYGLVKRTAYSIYQWEDKDKTAMVFLAFSAVFLCEGMVSKNLAWRYFPNIRGKLLSPMTILFYISFAALCFLPVYIDWKEERVWNSLRSRI